MPSRSTSAQGDPPAATTGDQTVRAEKHNTGELLRDGSTESGVVYVIVPHPDDEFQTWSLIENTPDQYKVFVVLTHGEHTGFCDPAGYAAASQPHLERPAVPTPNGRGSPECAQARANSLIAYLSDMSKTDPSIPGDFEAPRQSPPLPVDPDTICHVGDTDNCMIPDLTADVWIDRGGRGAVVFFNLGDGNLTEAEATWGIRTALDSRALLGINTTLPPVAALGSFANSEYGCYQYEQPDHVAVHQALWNTDFPVALQAAATCADDPDRSISATVSDASVDAAFRIGVDTDDFDKRIGAHVNNYGWLWPDYYHIDRDGQSLLFTQHQYFWIRFNETTEPPTRPISR